MFTLEFNNLKILNVSLQVGDAVYARDTMTQPGSNDPQAVVINDTGANHWIGILRRIEDNGGGNYVLTVDDSMLPDPIVITRLVGFFIMFSKYDQSDGDVLGYYAEAKFVNDSKVKAELYVVSSEVTMNSK